MLGVRVRWLLVGLLILVLVGVLLLLLLMRDGGSEADSSGGRDASGGERLAELALGADLGDPGAVEVPGAADASLTVEWLESDGTAVMELVDATRPLWRDSVPPCDAVAGELDEIGTPEQVLEAAVGTPDEVTRELLVDVHRAAIDLLAACDGDELERPLGVFAWQWALANRRLADLGVDR